MVDPQRLPATAAAIFAAFAVLPGPAIAGEAGVGDQVIAGLTPCWSPPIGADGRSPAVRLRLSLNRDGSLAGHPQVIGASSQASSKAAEAAAVRAVRRCTPLKLPPERFADWREIIVNFDPAQVQ